MFINYIIVSWLAILVGAIISISGVYISDLYLQFAAIGIMASLCGLALTPIGESFFRFTHGAREALKLEKSFLEPVFSRVVKNAGFERSDFDLLVMDDKEINAFALGRRSVIITRGAMQLPEQEIEGIFAHELGHMRHRDSIIMLMYYTVSSITNLAIKILMMIAAVMTFFKITRILGVAIGIMTAALLWLAVKPINVGNRYGGRLKEYRADRFAHEIGYGEGMQMLLTRFMDNETTERGMVNSLMATHPGSGKRLLALEKLAEKSGDIAAELA